MRRALNSVGPNCRAGIPLANRPALGAGRRGIVARPHDHRRRGDRGQLVVAELHDRDRLRGYTVDILDQDRVRQLGKGRFRVRSLSIESAKAGAEAE